MTTTQERISDDEAAILRSWLGGHNITVIAKARRTNQETVAATIDQLCNYNRETGRQVLDSGVRPTAPPAQVVPLVRKANPTVQKVPPADTPAPAAAGDTTPARSADRVLAQADQSASPLVRAVAASIRQNLAKLVGLIDEARIEAAARDLVEQKRRELAAAEERLAALTAGAEVTG